MQSFPEPLAMSISLLSATREYGLTEQSVLITGGAGFIGSHLVDTLVQTNSVTVLDNLQSGWVGNVHPQATLVEGDIRERDVVAEAMDGVDIVFHEAALVSVEESLKEPTKSNAINVTGTLNVLDCARQEDARVVAASSAAAYGKPETVPIPETTPLRPTSIYGVDKAALDQYTRRFESLYDLETVVLRYFNVYGPRQSASSYSGVISTFLEQARREEPLTIQGDGTQSRDFVHVSDVVRANLLAAKTDHTGEAFNIGTGRETSINELADTICQTLEIPPKTTTAPARDGDIDHSCADTEKAQRMLGFEPQVTLADGLETVQTFDSV